MAGPSDFSVRPPIAAGRFYPGEPAACRNVALSLLRSEGPLTDSSDIGRRGWGAIVPHAGWMCSGAIAGQAIAELARMNRDAPPDVVVVFGAVHTPIAIDRAALDSHDIWEMPGGKTRTATEFVRKLGAISGLFMSDDRFHRQEHAIEVELPLIEAAWPDARLVPVEVPLIDQAEQIGRETAQRMLSETKSCVFLASSDFTHYGPAYRFTPAGIGLPALEWAKRNDERLLRIVTDFMPARVVPEVRERANACGGGAIAAMLAACQEAGASRATLLRHANSYEMLAGLGRNDPANAVGYAGVVVS